MIVRIQGVLVDMTDEGAIVEREGLSYEVLIPAYARGGLMIGLGSSVSLHTLQYFEGNATGGNLIPRLIGFPQVEDKAFFRLFTSVKNMGMRKALKALALPIGQIAAAIESGDTKTLTQLPGIGKRMAEQIVAELKGKATAHALAEAAQPVVRETAFSADQRDAIEILVAWGDSRNDAERWVQRAAQQNGKLGGPDEWVAAAYRLKSG